MMSTANEIGARLRTERQARGLSLRSVAQSLGVSPSLISQVETGKSQPSVSTLYALANLMSISIDDLLGLQARGTEGATSAKPHIDLQRRGQNPVIEMENGVRWERLAQGVNGSVDALLVTYQPGGSSSLEGRLMRHMGVEYVYVLSGLLTLQLEFDTYELDTGDSVHFDSSRPHMFSNLGKRPATGIWHVIGRREPPRSPGSSGVSAAQATDAVLKRLDAIDPSEDQILP